MVLSLVAFFVQNWKEELEDENLYVDSRTFIFTLFPHEERFQQQAYEEVTNDNGETIKFIKCGLIPTLTVSVLGAKELERTVIPESTTHLQLEVSVLNSISHTLVLRKALFPPDVKLEDIKMEVDLHKFITTEQSHEVNSLRVELRANHNNANDLIGEVVIPLSSLNDGKQTKQNYKLHAINPLLKSKTVLELELGIKYQSVECQLKGRDKKNR